MPDCGPAVSADEAVVLAEPIVPDRDVRADRGRRDRPGFGHAAELPSAGRRHSFRFGDDCLRPYRAVAVPRANADTPRRERGAAEVDAGPCRINCSGVLKLPAEPAEGGRPTAEQGGPPSGYSTTSGSLTRARSSPMGRCSMGNSRSRGPDAGGQVSVVSRSARPVTSNRRITIGDGLRTVT